MATIDDYFRGQDSDDGRSGKTLSPIRPIEELQKAVTDMIDVGTEITVTFKPELSNRWQEQTLKEVTERVIRKSLKRCPDRAQLVLIGEHSPTGLFHYHGIFRGIPNDHVARLKRACARELGRTEIKMIKYAESYRVYMFKSYAALAELPEEWRSYSYVAINV